MSRTFILGFTWVMVYPIVSQVMAYQKVPIKITPTSSDGYRTLERGTVDGRAGDTRAADARAGDSPQGGH